MGKVQAGTLTEEFSFSRALHLMRNSGAKVRPCSFGAGQYFVLRHSSLGEEYFMMASGENMGSMNSIHSSHILGNWTLYDERIHGA